MKLEDLVKGQTCPRCRKETVVYNGNYFCSSCSWVMSESGRPARIVKAYLKQRMLEAEALGDRREVERLDGYLAKYLEKPHPMDSPDRSARGDGGWSTKVVRG